MRNDSLLITSKREDKTMTLMRIGGLPGQRFHFEGLTLTTGTYVFARAFLQPETSQSRYMP